VRVSGGADQRAGAARGADGLADITGTADCGARATEEPARGAESTKEAASGAVAAAPTEALASTRRDHSRPTSGQARTTSR
jgi:hypothetical protein